MGEDDDWGGQPDYQTVLNFWIDKASATETDRVAVKKGVGIIKYQGPNHQIWDYRDKYAGHLMLGTGIEYYFIWEFFSQFI